VEVADTREAAGIPAVVAAHISRPLIFLHPVAAAPLISPLVPRLTLVEAVHISPPVQAALLSTLLFMVRRLTMHS
jgi:hypothetical protein